jgi:hypothetical protein
VWALLASGLMADPLGVWFNTNWAMRIPLTGIRSTTGEYLQNFPLLIHITNQPLLANATPNGDDITFVDAYKNQLFHEIESFDRAAGNLTAWVCLPDLSVNGIINLYLSNTTGSYTFSGTNYFAGLTATLPTLRTNLISTNVWDPHFQLVLHFNETDTNIPLDSTRYNRVPVSYRNLYSSNTTHSNGIIGNCMRVDLPVSNRHQGTVPLTYDWSLLPRLSPFASTYSFWLNHAPVSNYLSVPGTMAYTVPLAHGGNGGGGYGLFRISTNNFIDAPQVNNVTVGGWRYPEFNTWQHFGLSGLCTNLTAIPGIFGTNFLLTNGIRAGSTANANMGTNWSGGTGNNLTIGGTINGGSQYFTINGSMDEFRWSTTNRSFGWMNTEYSNQANPNGFYQVGVPEYFGTGKMTVKVLTHQGAGVPGVAIALPPSGVNNGRLTDSRGIVEFGTVVAGATFSMTATPPAGVTLMNTSTNFVSPATDFTIVFYTGAFTNTTNELSMGLSSWFHVSGDNDLLVSVNKTNSAAERVQLHLLPVTGANRIRIYDQVLTGTSVLARVPVGEIKRLVTMGTWILELRVILQGKDENDFGNPVRRKILIITK